MEVPAEVVQRLAVWNRSAYIYFASGYVTLAVGILSGLAVTAFADSLDKKYIRFLGFLAAVATATLATFSPLDLGRNFRDAWRVLEQASLEYKYGHDKDLTKVFEALKAGENLIRSVDVTKQPTLPHNGAGSTVAPGEDKQ
jgi:hypothetical protein